MAFQFQTRKGADKPEQYTSWRKSLSHDVLELSAYPVDMLQEKYRQQLVEEGIELDGILYSGGLSRRIYGIPGVLAKGSIIETVGVP